MIEVLSEWLADLQQDLFDADNFLNRLKIFSKMEKISILLDAQYVDCTEVGHFEIIIEKERI